MVLLGCQSTGQDGKRLTPSEIAEKRSATIKMGSSGLTVFYKQNPAAKKEIEAAPGYALVSTTNVNVVLLVVARGEGVLYDKRRKEPNFSAGSGGRIRSLSSNRTFLVNEQLNDPATLSSLPKKSQLITTHVAVMISYPTMPL